MMVAVAKVPPPAGGLLSNQALQLAAQGFRVFPLQPASKAPLAESRGFKDCTQSPMVIRALWQAHPRANIGIATGAGLLVVDLDTHDGQDGPSWATARPDLCPPTVTALTPTGGKHLYYQTPAGVTIPSRNALAPGVDIKADGGYVVSPPSRHPAGGMYDWAPGASPADCSLTPAPAALLALLTAPTGAPVAPPVAPPTRPRPGDTRISAALWIRKALTRQGKGRNDAGFWLGCQLRDSGYSESEAERHALDYAHQVSAGGHAYTDREVCATVRSVYQRPPRPAPAGAPALGQPTRRAAPLDLPALVAAVPDTGTAATYEAEVYELIHMLAAETARADALQDWKDKACAILFTNEDLAPGHRFALLALQCFIETEHLPQGTPVEIMQQSWATRAGVSPATVSRWLDDWQEMGLATHEVRPDPLSPIFDRQGRPLLTRDGRQKVKNKTYLACQAAPFEVEIAILQGPQGRRKNTPRPQGGLRDCPTCGADGAEQDLLTDSPRQCRACHTVYSSSGTILAPTREPDSCLQVATNDLSACKLQADETPMRETAERVRSMARDGHARARQAVNIVEWRTHRRAQDADTSAYHAGRHSPMTDQGAAAPLGDGGGFLGPLPPARAGAPLLKGINHETK